jgi:site-specific recombinase XerD
MKVTRLTLEHFTAERVQRFLRYLEVERGNHIRSRNHRLAALRTFFDYVAGQAPEMLEECTRIASISTKRVAPPETTFLERDEVAALLRSLPSKGRLSARDRALILFLYNTGARVQEVAELRVRHLDLASPARVRLHGKGDKWRTCPLWEETACQLKGLIESYELDADGPIFLGPRRQPLTRFGIYKIVRRHAAFLDVRGNSLHRRRVSPHIFRHTAAMHLLESGVEVNVIRGWLGHVSLETTNRYAEITIRAKEAALRACESVVPETSRARVKWRNDETLLSWLAAL